MRKLTHRFLQGPRKTISEDDATKLADRVSVKLDFKGAVRLATHWPP